MRILLVHQNFPGQFRDIAPALCDRGHELKAISSCNRKCDPRIEVLRYSYKCEKRSGIHSLTAEVDEWIKRGELVGKKAKLLKDSGWAPDIMLAHPGWGEAMLLKHVYTSTPLVIWPELWLGSEHLGIKNDDLDIGQAIYLRTKNWLLDGAMADCSLAILPTDYQANSFPERWQSKIQIIPEGVPEHLFEDRRLQSLCIGSEIVLSPDKQVLTFISRNLEPMRGFHLLMRALPKLQSQMPRLEVVFVGGDDVSYSSKPEEGKTWKELLLCELDGNLDLRRIHFLGRLPHEELIKLYRRSDLHVYLSNAFVLSWSLLEIMATGTSVLTADNPMLREMNGKAKKHFIWKPQDMTLHEAIIAYFKSTQKLEVNDKHTLYSLFSLSRCVDELEAVLLKTAGGSF